MLLNPISADAFNDIIYESEEQQKSFSIKLCAIKDDNGQNVRVIKYTLKNKQKVVIEIINYGATVISCWVPNALGELEDVLLGFDSIENYRLQKTHSIGGTLGGVTDYISNGHLENDNGEKGFDKVMWDGYLVDDELVLTYSSKDGEEGYPGTFEARTTFRLTCKNELVVNYVGMTSKSTPVNMASNMFFNLAGQEQTLQV
ncbi:aldose 1-epimerase-like [Acyrthosiphon pisum]|uniref:Galactose mutarotase n=1 Tax=Acyrthosiphon pisum TaxID=7029 RepID=A0A8R2NKJ5_ACYPI|nr:aldose 1-epimerase-like [Acyrthosiphon pisum]